LSADGTSQGLVRDSFYQIYPQSFFDRGSGKPGTGSFKGIEAKLDYLKDLGIDCLWLTPIFLSSFNAYGYDIIDYKDIDTRYGSKADLEHLITAVHSKRLKIIVDFVPNHCGEAHPFFQKSKLKQDGYDDWFMWTFVPDRNEFYYVQFYYMIYRWRQVLDDYQKAKNSEAKNVSDDGTKNGAHLPFNFQMINVIQPDSKA
jgi:glycosidase